MIDYKKLKLAHELAQKYAIENYPRKIDIILRHQGNIYQFYLQIIEYGSILFDWQVSMEEMIEKLKELTQPNLKYKEGQEVWINLKNIPTIATVWGEEDSRYHLGLDSGHIHVEESEIYPTKSELIEAQCRYWKIQLDEESSSLSSCCSLHTGTTEKCREECDHDGKKSNGLGHDFICNKCDQYIIYYKCEHESNGQTSIMPYPMQYKCKKCGEFYK